MTRLLSKSTLLAALVLLMSGTASAGPVTIAWDPNKEADLAGYVVHYGTASGVYTHRLDVGKVTTATIATLIDGKTYFFAIQAYSTKGTGQPDVGRAEGHGWLDEAADGSAATTATATANTATTEAAAATSAAAVAARGEVRDGARRGWTSDGQASAVDVGERRAGLLPLRRLGLGFKGRSGHRRVHGDVVLVTAQPDHRSDVFRAHLDEAARRLAIRRNELHDAGDARRGAVDLAARGGADRDVGATVPLDGGSGRGSLLPLGRHTSRRQGHRRHRRDQADLVHGQVAAGRAASVCAGLHEDQGRVVQQRGLLRLGAHLDAALSESRCRRREHA